MYRHILVLSILLGVSLYSAEAATASTTTVAGYLAQRLAEIGSTTVFGVTGDYSYLFLHAVEAHPNLTRVGNNNELEAGYAAWGYARAHPKQVPGAFSVTYGVGGYPALSTVVGAYVDNVPVIFIAGTPSTQQWQLQDSFGMTDHHQFPTGYKAQRDAFATFTEAQVIVNNAQLAAVQIDQIILAAFAYRKPVYIEVWTDIWNSVIPAPAAPLDVANIQPEATDNGALAAAIAETLSRIRNANFPVINAGRELKLYGLQDTFEKMINFANLPYYTNQAAKGIITEGNNQQILATTYSNQIDFLLELGTVYDQNDKKAAAGFYPNAVPFPNATFIKARKGSVQTSFRKLYANVPLKPFVEGLYAAIKNANFILPTTKYNGATMRRVFPQPYTFDPNSYLTYNGFLNHLKAENVFNNDTVAVVDTTLINSWVINNVSVHRDGYFGDNVYLSIGWTGGSSLGINRALPDKKTIVIVGDGGFQNCPTGLGTAAAYHHNSIVFVLHNNIYVIEQQIEDPTPFTNPAVPFFPENIIQDWNYEKYASAMGAKSDRVYTHAELTKAITKAMKHNDRTTLIEVMLPERDRPTAN